MSFDKCCHGAFGHASLGGADEVASTTPLVNYPG
jgi:hypothetical protein